MKNRKRSKSAASAPGALPGRKMPDDRRPRPPAAGRTNRPSPRTTALAAVICAFLLLAVMLVFGQTLGHGFVNFDDDDYVCQNHHVIGGLTTEGIGWAFTATHSSNWHPLTWLSHMLDCQLYGLKPWGHHLSSVVLHAATAIVLLLALWRMTGDLWPSAFVAALFAIHPLRVESVAWVAERKDVLSGLFFMLTLVAYVSYARRPFSLVRYLMVVVLFALGLMAKPMLVTLPFVLLLLDYWPLGRLVHSTPGSQAPAWEPATGVPKPELGNEINEVNDVNRRILPTFCRLVTEKLPLLALSAASCVVTSLAQGESAAPLEILPLSSRAANALVSSVAYLRQFFWPVELAAYYPHAQNGLPTWQVVGAALLLAGITAGVVACWRRCPWLSVGWFWYLGMLVPVIGLVQVGQQAMADRYTYLPQIGLAIALAWQAKRALASWPYGALAGGIASALVLAALMGCARQQASYWRDSETLWNHALACTSGNVLAQVKLGATLQEQGRLAEAIDHYQEALKIQPNYVVTHNNLGAALCDQGHVQEALDEIQRAIQIKPDYADAHNSLGVAFAKRKELDKAITEYQTALAIEPDNAKAHNNFGVALYRKAEVADAIAHYKRALEIDPWYAEARYNLANALTSQGKWDEALAEYRQAIKIKPDYAEARNNLGVALQQLGNMPEAIAQWGELIRLRPNSASALNQLAWVLATSPEASVRNGREAIELARQAVVLTEGRDVVVLDTLAAAYAEAGRFPEAVRTAEQALALASDRKNTAQVDVLRGRIKLYQSGAAYREAGALPSRPTRP